MQKFHFESILIGAGFVLVIFALLLNNPRERVREELSQVAEKPSTVSQVSVDDAKVALYRRQIGDRLIQERIALQYENLEYKDSARPYGQAELSSVLDGAPMEGEKHPIAAKEKPPEALNDLEAEIRERITFEKNLQHWEDNARAQFIAEFIARAEAMGYRVQIDRDFNVFYEYEGVRSPQNVDFQIPLLLRAPRCKNI